MFVLDMKIYIYSLEFPEGNIRYIGKSIHPDKRLKDHIKESRYRQKSRRDHWIKSLGETLPYLNIIEEVKENNWIEREIYWIQYFKEKGFDLVNGTSGGEGSDGFKGRKHTDETKAKISNSAKGKIVSEETKLKHSGENNHSCKLSDNDALELIYLYNTKQKTIKQLSEIYKLNRKYIPSLIKGRRRKYLQNEIARYFNGRNSVS